MSVAKVPRLERTSTVDQVAEAIRLRILNGTFGPGMTLPEVALAKSLGISRNTLREGLRVLHGEGLIRRSAHRGARVSGVSTEDLAEIYRLRTMLEVAAIHSPHAAERLAPVRAEVKNLEAAIAARDWLAVVESDRGFHCAIISLLQSRRLERFFAQLLAELRLGLMRLDRTMDRSLHEMVAQHGKILAALERHEVPKADRLLREHLAESEQRVRKVLTPARKS